MHDEHHFVPQYGRNEDDRHMRKTIRRHVMLGKNRGKTREPKQPTQEGYAVFHKDDWIRNTQLEQRVVPRRIGSDLSFLRFADTVEPAILSQTLQFCATSDEKMFALQPCIAFDSANSASTCIQLLAHDALHLNTMVFGAQTYMNQVFWQATSEKRQSPRHVMSRHYGQALSLLRARLAEIGKQSSEISGIVITAITSLAMSALASGDSADAKKHVVGLSKVVNMTRPRIHSLGNPKHLIELLRCDIFVSLATGQSPLFFSDHLHEHYFPLVQPEAVDSRLELSSLINEAWLAEIWIVLSHFCDQINEAVANQRKLPDQLLLKTVAPVMYRLLNKSSEQDSKDETTRLALLSFCASALLSWHQLRMPISWLQQKYRQAIHNLMLSSVGPLDSGVKLWYLATYATAFHTLPADANDELNLWLATVLSTSQLTDWTGVKRVLAKFLWIDIVCNPQMQKLVEKTLASNTAVLAVIVDPAYRV